MSIQKFNKNIEELNNISNQINLTDPLPNSSKIFFESAHETFSKRNHVLGYNINFNKF